MLFKITSNLCIDYLRKQASVKQVWYSLENRRHEHDWAELMRQIASASAPAPRFGASDCRCHTHLIHTIECPRLQHFQNLVRTQFPSDIPISAVDAN